MPQRRGTNTAEVDGRVSWWAIGLPSNSFVLSVHLVPLQLARSRGTAVELMKGAFAQQHDQLRCLQRTRTAIEIVVHEAASRKGELLFEATQLAPHFSRHEESAALPHRPEPPTT